MIADRQHCFSGLGLGRDEVDLFGVFDGLSGPPPFTETRFAGQAPAPLISGILCRAGIAIVPSR